MKRTGGLCIVVLYLGCGHPGLSVREPALPTPTVGLWELAPVGTDRALVFHDGSLPELGPSVRSLVAALRADPVAPRGSWWRWLRPAIDGRLEELGLDLTRGLALFFTTEGVGRVILPVAHRDRFRGALGGERVEPHLDRFDGFWCEERQGRYLCAGSERALGGLARSDPHAFAPALRAPIELMDRDGLRAEIRAEVGTITVRARIPGRLAAPARSNELAAGLADVHPTAFLISRGFPLGPCTGDIVAYTLPGAPRGVVKLGAADEATGRALLSRCRALLPIARSHPIDARSAPGALVVGIGQPGPVVEAALLSPLARELLAPRWTFASWGRGFHAPALPILESLLATDPLLAAAERWLIAHLVEAGVGIEADEAGIDVWVVVRTTLAYPEALAAAMEPVPPFERLARLAQDHPGTDLAADVAAGPGMVGTGLISVGVPLIVSRGVPWPYEETR
jgi:hypothetical protein